MSNLFKRALSLKLNAGAFEDLAQEGVPAEVTRTLQPLRDRSFGSRGELTAAITPLMGDDAARRYGASVARAARVLRARRVSRYLASYWYTFVPPSRYVFSFYRYFTSRPLILFIRLRLRWWWFTTLSKLRGRPAVAQAANANVAGFIHNRNQVLSFLEGHRNRTESMMNVMRSIQGLDLRGSRLLCVGPRNEAEVLLLHAYGLRRRNVQTIDLFSYSPLIRVMDMNTLEFADDSFDIYYSSAVIKYSPDIRRTVAESLRVTRNGGLMVFGFMFGEITGIIPEGSDLSGGVRDLLALYGDHVEHVYWNEEFPLAPGDTRAAAIFRIRK